MKTAVLVLHMIFALALVGVVLIQRSEGGGLGLGSGNLGGLMTTRGTSNLLTRITGILAAIFFINTIVLALLFKGDAKPKSILDTPASTSIPSAPISEKTESEKKSDLALPESAPIEEAPSSALPEGKQSTESTKK